MDNTTSDDLEKFFSQYPLKSYHKGQILIYSGDDPKGIFYLEKGSVRKYDINASGSEVVLNVFTSNVFFPASWVANGAPIRYFYEAVTPIEVRRAPVDAFVTHLKENPDVTFGLLKHTYEGIECAQRRVVMLMSASTSRRLMLELIIEGRRSGEMHEDGSCVIGVGIADLAQRAGLSRETISRELTRFIHEEKILSRTTGRSLVIHDFHALEAMLGEY